MRRNKTTDQYAEETRRVFGFDLKESEEECLTETGREFQITGTDHRKRVPDHRSDVLKGSLSPRATVEAMTSLEKKLTPGVQG